MAVQNEIKQQLLKKVLDKYPAFVEDDLNTGGRPTVFINFKGGFARVQFLSSRCVERIPHCCGVVEIGGLQPLMHLDDADLALFQLWMENNCGLPFIPMCCIATTANSWFEKKPTRIERALFKAGWYPECRGVNTIHGNHVILWIYKNTADSMYKEFGGPGGTFKPEGLTLDELYAKQGVKNAFA